MFACHQHGRAAAADAVRSERSKILSAVMICHCRRAVLDRRPGRQKPNQQLTVLVAIYCECLIETSDPEEQFTPKGHIAGVKVSQSEPVVGSGKLLVLSLPNPGEIVGGRRRRGIEEDGDGAQNNTLVCSLVGI